MQNINCAGQNVGFNGNTAGNITVKSNNNKLRWKYSRVRNPNNFSYYTILYNFLFNNFTFEN